MKGYAAKRTARISAAINYFRCVLNARNYFVSIFVSVALIGCATSPSPHIPAYITVEGETLNLYRSRPDLVLELVFNWADSGVAALEAAKKRATNDVALNRQLDQSIQRIKRGYRSFHSDILEMQSSMNPGDRFFQYQILRPDYEETGYLILDPKFKVRRRLKTDSLVLNPSLPLPDPDKGRTDPLLFDWIEPER